MRVNPYVVVGIICILAVLSIVAINDRIDSSVSPVDSTRLEPAFTPEREPLITSDLISNANRQIVSMQQIIDHVNKNLDSIERNMAMYERMKPRMNGLNGPILKPTYSSNYMAPTSRIGSWMVSNGIPFYFIQYTSNIYHQIELGVPPDGITYHGSNGTVWDAKWVKREVEEPKL